MIVAIANQKIIAHADTVSECAEKVLCSDLFWSSAFPLAPGMVRYRVAPVWLQSLADRGQSLDTFTVVVSGDDVIAEDDDNIRTIREHVLAKALENTK